MHHNRRPPMKASALRPDQITLLEGESPKAKCPDCRARRILKRGMVPKHYLSNEQGDVTSVPCSGGGQRIELDLTPEQWGEAMFEASTDANQYRSKPVRKKPTLPAPTPVHQMNPQAPKKRRAKRPPMRPADRAQSELSRDCYRAPAGMRTDVPR